MTNAYGISKVEDADGSNYIIRSNLLTYSSKTKAKAISIKAVTSGIEHYEIDGTYQALTKDNFIIVHPGQEVNVQIDAPTPVAGTCYYLDPALIRQITIANTKSVDANLSCMDSNGTDHNMLDNIPVHTFNTFLSNLPDPSALDQLTKEDITERFIGLAENLVGHQSHIKKQMNLLEGARHVTKQELYRRLQSGRRFIHEHFGDSITLNEMAKEAGLSAYYFHRNFRYFFNLTPYQYHHEVRMVKARDMLALGNQSRKEVALHCGYDDPKYFAKVFKKWQVAH